MTVRSAPGATPEATAPSPRHPATPLSSAPAVSYVHTVLDASARLAPATADFWAAEFNKAADTVLPAIEGDQSPTAVQLRASIADVRAMPKNLQVIEASRSTLLTIR